MKRDHSHVPGRAVTGQFQTVPVSYTHLASHKSVAASFEVLEPEGSRWHNLKYIGIFGCYLLMMFYTMVGGWKMYYCYRSLKGDFSGASTEMISDAFGSMLGDLPTMTFWTILICLIGFAVCVLAVSYTHLDVYKRQALIGANGAGKSTTFKAILGLIRPESGSLKVLGKPRCV